MTSLKEDFIGESKKLRKRMDSISLHVNNMIHKNLGIEAPLVWIENERGSAEDKEDALERCGEYTLLPDGTRYADT